MKLYSKVQYFLVIFGGLTLLFNLSEFFWSESHPLEVLVTVVQCLLGIGLIYAPELLRIFFKIKFSDNLVYFYWFFLLISVFVGTCLHMMDYIFFWDKILHMTSPMILTAVGYGILHTMLESPENEVNQISPIVFLVFGFLFAGVCGIFWEFWEWGWDALADMNLQRYMTVDGQLLVGRAALRDTMMDFVFNTFGALVMGAFSWFQVKKDASFFDQFRIELLK